MKVLTNFRRCANALTRNSKGTVLIELALVIPILLTLVSGGFEVTRFALLYQKVNRIAVSMADLVSQAKTISETDITGLFDAVDHIGEPFDTQDNCVVIVSSVSLHSGTPTINWQRDGGGDYTATSRIGSTGGTATLPSGFVVHDGDSVIVAEVFYNYQPAIFTGIISQRILYNVAYFRPRLGTLDTVDPS